MFLFDTGEGAGLVIKDVKALKGNINKFNMAQLLKRKGHREGLDVLLTKEI